MRAKEEIFKDGTRTDILILEVLLDIREALKTPLSSFTAVSEPIIEVLPFEPEKKPRRKKRKYRKNKNTEVN